MFQKISTKSNLFELTGIIIFIGKIAELSCALLNQSQFFGCAVPRNSTKFIQYATKTIKLPNPDKPEFLIMNYELRI